MNTLARTTVGLLAALLTLSSSYGASPVKLSVYMETKCPDSQAFYTGQLFPVWTDLKDIMLMDINFYGKATDKPSEGGYVFQCQHGDQECDGNKLMACAKHSMTLETYLTFGNCIMDVFNATGGGQTCADKVGVDYAPLEKCWTSVEGQNLLHNIGETQRTLVPQPYYVPWILINDVFSDEQMKAAEENLRKVICDDYEGEKPDKCNT